MTIQISACDRAVGLAQGPNAHARQSLQLTPQDLTQWLLAPRCLHAFLWSLRGELARLLDQDEADVVVPHLVKTLRRGRQQDWEKRSLVNSYKSFKNKG